MDQFFSKTYSKKGKVKHIINKKEMLRLQHFYNKLQMVNCY